MRDLLSLGWKKWENLFEDNNDRFNQQYKKALDFLEKELKLWDKKYWFEVSIVSECVKWEWIGFTWTIMSLLISWIYYLENRLTIDQLSDYPHIGGFWIAKLHDQSYAFNYCYCLL